MSGFFNWPPLLLFWYEVDEPAFDLPMLISIWKFQIQKPNLILNVDGCIAVCFVDLMRQCGCFTKEESQEFIDIGALNAVFVLGRR